MISLDPSIMRDNPDLLRLNPELSEGSGRLPKGQEERPKRSKYGNIRTEYRGRVYDSKAEARRAAELDALVPAEIVAWFPQVTFNLAGGIRYRCDFLVILPDGTWRAEDCKGFQTQVWKIKQKLFREKYNMDIKVI